MQLYKIAFIDCGKIGKRQDEMEVLSGRQTYAKTSCRFIKTKKFAENSSILLAVWLLRDRLVKLTPLNVLRRVRWARNFSVQYSKYHQIISETLSSHKIREVIAGIIFRLKGI